MTTSPSLCFGEGNRLAPRVVVDACANVSSEEVTRLLLVELSVSRDAPPETEGCEIRIHCTKERATIVLIDEFGKERLKRSLLLDQSVNEAPERTLAVATAELLHALSWVSPDEPIARAAVTAPQEPPSDSVAPEGALTREGEVGVAAGGVVMVRSLQSQALIQYGASALIRYGWGDSFAIGLAGDWVTGHQAKSSGEIVASSWAGGLALLGKWPSSHLLFAEARFAILARHVALRGQTQDVGVVGDTIRGFVPELLLQVGPAARWNSVQVTLLADGGLTLSNLTGSVTGDSSLNYGGLWLGATLEVAWFPRRWRL